MSEIALENKLSGWNATAKLIVLPGRRWASEPKPQQTDATQLPPVQMDSALVELLFGHEGSNPQPQPPPEDAAPAKLHEIPAGMHEGEILHRVLAIEEPFTGIAVSIAFHDDPGSEPSEQLFPRFMASLLEKGEFGCLISGDEFLLVSPGLSGISAKRRLERISERLWNLQLGLSCSRIQKAGEPKSAWNSLILFSWGAAEAEGARLLDVVTEATEKMLQTKHYRKTVCIDSAACQPLKI